MLTAFGKKVRKLRIDKGVRLKDTADFLKVSSAYLSAIETGKKKKVPEKVVEGVAKYFKLKGEEKTELKRLAIKSADEVRISLKGLSEDSIETAAVFARKFPKMKPVDMKALMRVLEKVKVKE